MLERKARPVKQSENLAFRLCLKMYLSKLQNLFVKFFKYICTYCIMYFYNLPSKRKQGGRRKVGGREGRPAKRSEDLALELSVFQKKIVQISKCICKY